MNLIMRSAIATTIYAGRLQTTTRIRAICMLMERIIITRAPSEGTDTADTTFLLASLYAAHN